MRVRVLLLPVLLALALWQGASPALAANQAVALFNPGIVDGSASSARGGDQPDDIALAERLGQELRNRLQDRFDIRVAGPDAGTGSGDFRKRRARALGATYALWGTLTRIGRSVTLDLTLAPIEEPGRGKTVVVTGTDADPPAPAGKELAFIYRRLAIEGSAKLKLAFFGDEAIGEGAARRKIPRLAGTIVRSRSLPGDPVSVAMTDTDRNGKEEVVVAYGDSVGIHAVEGDDLAEKARIPYPGGGIVRVDAADLNRNGIAEIVVVRYVSGKAVSDIWEYDGTQYGRIASGLPYFLRTLDLGAEGIVIVGQESDPAAVFRGPVFRLSPPRSGSAEATGRGNPLPLPAGTWIYSFVPLKAGGTMRYAVLGDGGRLSLLDGKGERLWAGTDGISGTDLALDAPLAGATDPRNLSMPNRLFAVDTDGDGYDEIIALNNLVVPGGFFENIRVYSNSEALCFAQEGDRLALAWRTPQFDGAARDSFVASRKGRGPLRIGVATRDKGKILGSIGEWRILWIR